MDDDHDDGGSGTATPPDPAVIPTPSDPSAIEAIEEVTTILAQQDVDPAEVVAGDDEIMEHVDEAETDVV